MRAFYSFINISRKLKRNSSYRLTLSSRLLLSLSSKTRKISKYASFLNYLKRYKTSKISFKRAYRLRRFLRRRKYLPLPTKFYCRAQLLSPVQHRPARYQIKKLRKIFHRNRVFLKLRRNRFKRSRLKRKLIRFLSIVTSDKNFVNLRFIDKFLLSRLNYTSLYPLFKLFLFICRRPRKLRRRRRRLPANRFQQLSLLTQFYENNDFSFNLFRRAYKVTKTVKRRRGVIVSLPLNGALSRKKKRTLIKRNTYGIEVLGQKGPTTAEYVHRYKFILLKLRKRRRWKFTKFHLLYPKLTTEQLYRNKKFLSKRKRRRWVWKSRIKVDSNANLRIAKYYYYRLRYFNRVHTPRKRFFFKKKALRINKFYPSLGVFKKNKSLKKSFKRIVRLKNSLRNVFFKSTIFKKNRKIYRKFKRIPLFYRNLHFKYYTRRKLSKKLFILNRNTTMYAFPILRSFSLKTFNLLIFFKPKYLAAFFKEKFSKLIRFLRRAKFIDRIFFSKILRFLSIVFIRLSTIQKKSVKFGFIPNALRTFTLDLTYPRNVLTGFMYFLSFFMRIERKKLICTIPDYEYTEPYTVVTPAIDRRRKLIGLVKYSLLAKQKQHRIDSTLRRRKDVWLQPEFIILNFKNLLIKRGLGVRAEKLLSSFILSTKFTHKLNLVKFFTENRPLFGVKPRRKGSQIQQIPMLLTSKRSVSLAQRQVLKFASKRGDRTLISRVYNECINTIENRSSSSKALAEQNRSIFLNRVLL